MPSRILIADDDPFSRTILEAVLSGRGEAVTVAGDGLAAVKLLGSRRFDLAILDYHMPLLDGVGAARKVHELIGKACRPRFIGITADPDGLEERDQTHGIFDAIVQKPINIECLLDVVEASLRQVREAAATDKVLDVWRARGLDRCPRARFATSPGAATRMQLERVFDLGKPENPDCILITDDADATSVARLRTAGNLYTLPAIDLTGRFERTADAAFRLYEVGTWDDVAVRVRDFASRRHQLTRRFLGTTDPGDQLLAYVFVSGHDLRPVIDLAEDYGISYPGLFPTAKLLPAAERLVQKGLLRRLKVTAQTSSAGPAKVLMSAPHFALSDAALEKLTGVTGLDQLDQRAVAAG